MEVVAEIVSGDTMVCGPERTPKRKASHRGHEVMKTEVEPKGGPMLQSQQPSQSIFEHLRRLTSFREFMILAIVIAGCLVMSITTPIFMTFGNWSALLLQVSIECIVAIGMTIFVLV